VTGGLEAAFSSAWIPANAPRHAAAGRLVRVLGGDGFVLAAHHLPQPFDSAGQTHNSGSSAEKVGQKLSKVKIIKRTGSRSILGRRCE
jgi:hypothetical protein